MAGAAVIDAGSLQESIPRFCDSKWGTPRSGEIPLNLVAEAFSKSKNGKKIDVLENMENEAAA